MGYASEFMRVAAFTGERPGWGEDFDYDEARHLAAYFYARELAAGLEVLDAGCGEGFGTRYLAEVAASVVGVDYSAEAVAACRSLWAHPSLRFECVDLTATSTFSETFDLVTNFQVLEHIVDEIPFLESLGSRLAAGGTLVLTTPNRLRSFSENPYHIREYTAEELEALLRRVFPEVSVMGMHGNERVEDFDRERERAVKRILRLDPLGIRHRLPSALINAAFASLATLVRRQAKSSSESGTLVPEDFHVSAERLDDALDLVALCRFAPDASAIRAGASGGRTEGITD